MKQWMKKRKSRGFTLVELLIVIVIIGILAGSLLLVMGSGTDKANATKIVSDMRTLKAAALMYYADANAWPTGIADVYSYLDRSPMANPVASLDIVGSATVSADCAIQVTNVTGTGVIARLAQIASEVGLYASDLTAAWTTGSGYMIVAH